MTDPVHDWALKVSLLGFASFFLGYCLRPFRLSSVLPDSIIYACEDVAYRLTLWIAIPALILAIQFFIARSGVQYGEGTEISIWYQAVLYLHLYVGLLFLGIAREIKGRRRIWIAALLLTLPRLIISLHWGRFFVAQALVPIILIALARGWLGLTTKKVVGLGVLGVFILFVPSLTRGDRVLENDQLVRFFAAGSSLQLLQANKDLDLQGRCPPLLVSMTASIFPYHELGVCTLNIWGRKDLPATLDRILAYNDPYTDGTLNGPGANFLLELYLSGGMVVVVLGSLLFGYSNRCFVDWIGRPSIFAGIWAECLTRSLFSPRNTLGYVYQRIPTLVATTAVVILIVYVGTAYQLRLRKQKSQSEEDGLALPDAT